MKNMQKDLSNSRLTLVEVVRKDKRGYPIGLYSCSCGASKEISLHNVENGRTLSCGCLRKEKLTNNKLNYKHGLGGTPLYDVWFGMMRRCKNPSHKNYHQYGGRGIKVCQGWSDVSVFNQWAIENGYKNGLQIDRKDQDGDYSPENCRFVTSKVNNNNRRDNRLLSLNGRHQTLQQWAEEKNCTPEKIRMRIDKLKWSVERALTE